MRLAVIGSRTFINQTLIYKYLDAFNSKCKVDAVVSGGAKGPDSIGESWAKQQNIPTKIFLPEWKIYGKSAGFRRNKDIINFCDVVIAFLGW